MKLPRWTRRSRIIEATSRPVYRPKPIAMIPEEGCECVPWVQHENTYQRAHAILFEDGSIFDMYGGWRDPMSAEAFEDIKKFLETRGKTT